MNRTNFLNDLAAILEVSPALLTPEFQISDGDWDSVALLSTMALIDAHCGLTVSGEALARCRTVEDVLRLAAPSDPV